MKRFILLFFIIPFHLFGQNKQDIIIISSDNGHIDWKSIHSNASIIYVRATEGISLNDSLFIENIESIKQTPYLSGAYLVYDPNVKTIDQFETFTYFNKKGMTDITPMIIVKDVNTDMSITIQELSYLSYLMKDYYGSLPIINCNLELYENHINKDEFNACIESEIKPEINCKNGFIWKYTNKGHITGINGEVGLCSVFINNLNLFWRY